MDLVVFEREKRLFFVIVRDFGLIPRRTESFNTHHPLTPSNYVLLPQTFIYPLEVAKTRFAVSAAGQFGSLSHCLKVIIAPLFLRRED